MRAARPGPVRHKTLSAQADVSHTFGPLLIPLTLILVGWGGFQLDRSLKHPLESDAAALLFASVLLACGLLLTIYLLRAFRMARVQAEARKNELETSFAGATVRRTKVVSRAAPPRRPFHGYYVDDARISR